MPLYREDLDHGVCDVPACSHSHEQDPLYFHAGCHPSAPTWAKYLEGELLLECSVCRRPVVEIGVAPRPLRPRP